MAITMKEKAEVLKNNPVLNNILVNNDWEWTGIANYGRESGGRWLNIYWYHYAESDLEDSPVFFSDGAAETPIWFFKLWNQKDEEYTKVGILPTGEFVMFAGTNSRTWGLAPGTELNCRSYTVRSVYEIADTLGLNALGVIDLIALRCACCPND